MCAVDFADKFIAVFIIFDEKVSQTKSVNHMLALTVNAYFLVFQFRDGLSGDYLAVLQINGEKICITIIINPWHTR